MIQKIDKKKTQFSRQKFKYQTSHFDIWGGPSSMYITGVTCKSRELNITVNFILNPHYTQIKRRKNID